MEDNALKDSGFGQEEGYRTQYTKQSEKGGGSGKFVFIIIGLLLIGGIAFGAQKFVLPMLKTAQAPAPTPTPTPTFEEDFPTETPTPSPEESPAPEDTSPTTKPTLNPIDKATKLDRSELNVEIQNGGGVVGAASKASEALKTLGYHVIATGNADNYTYENVIINVKSGKSSFLDLLKKDLGINYTIGSTSAALSDSSTADAVVIIGK